MMMLIWLLCIWVDSNNALDGDGPFTPERSGGLPSGQLAKLCFSGKYSHPDVKKMITGKGGIVAYFGTNNMMEMEEKAKTDPKAKLLFEAMAYQISKEIAAQASVVCGEVEAVILTGGLAYSDYFLKEITARVRFIAPVAAYPGEHELMALAQGALRVLKGEEEAQIYL
jgi:butyrate kinase